MFVNFNTLRPDRRVYLTIHEEHGICGTKIPEAFYSVTCDNKVAWHIKLVTQAVARNLH